MCTVGLVQICSNKDYIYILRKVRDPNWIAKV